MERKLGFVSVRCVTGVLIVLATVVPTATAGQQTSDASIVGQITDESGAVLPGVAVTATSPALQVPQLTTVSDERGEYRLAPLPIGTYDVAYTLQGFQGVKRESIRLTVGFVAKLDVEMKLGAIAETIMVSGDGPVVDVTSTSTTTQLTRETLELIPSTRNGLLSVLAQAPAVRGVLDVGGSNFSALPAFSTYGQIGEQWVTVEGVATTDGFKTGGYTGSGNFFDYTSFEETRLTSVNKPVSVPVRGVSIDAIVKSGGNDFHGEAFFGGTTDALQSANIDADLTALGVRGANRLNGRWDTNAELGGRLVPNKLWFWGSGRVRKNSQQIPNVFKPDGSPGDYTEAQRYGTGKVSYQATAANRFVVFYQGLDRRNDGSPNQSIFVPWESRNTILTDTRTYKVQWQGVKSDVVMSLQYGGWRYVTTYLSHANGQVSTNDIATQFVTGDSTSDRFYFRSQRQHATGSLSWYKSNGLWGNHDVRSGFDVMPLTYVYGLRSRPAGDYVLLFNNGVPFQLNAYNSPVISENNVNYWAAYLSDNWVIARRLTVNLGLRFAHDVGDVPAQCRDAGEFAEAECTDRITFRPWNSLAPRLSVAYDLNGEGKTVVKAGWSRYDFTRDNNLVASANPLTPITTTYRWHDLNNDKLYQRGEIDLDPNGPDFVRLSGYGFPSVPDPNWKQQKQNEYFLSLEHQLIPNMSVRVTGIYSNVFNVPRWLNHVRPYSAYNIPITNPDPGPDGRVNTADDPGTILTYYDYPAAYAGRTFEFYSPTSLPGQPEQTFKALEVAATKRLADRWQFMASFVATKKNIPIPEDTSSLSIRPFNPNEEINIADRTWEWLGRASAAYLFPLGIIGSANYEDRSGEVQARSVLLTGGQQVPTMVLNAEPPGSLRLPQIRNLDVRIEKVFVLKNTHKLTARLNAYNLLNFNTITSRNVRSGANFLMPSAILPPRVFELGASYVF